MGFCYIESFSVEFARADIRAPFSYVMVPCDLSTTTVMPHLYIVAVGYIFFMDLFEWFT